MNQLSDIEEITEVTDEKTTQGFPHAVVADDTIDVSFRQSLDGDSKDCSEKFSKRSRKQNILVNIDPSLLQMVSAINDDSDDDSDERKSKLFCFSCCDLVRACIVTNILNIAFMINVLLISIIEIPNLYMFDLYQSKIYYDDDEVLSVQRSPDRKDVLALSRTGIAILFSAIGVFGALQFHQWMVLCTAIWYCIYIIASCIDLRFFDAVIAVFFAYPNWHLFVVLQSGSITRENYSTEKYCCCSPSLSR